MQLICQVICKLLNSRISEDIRINAWAKIQAEKNNRQRLINQVRFESYFERVSYPIKGTVDAIIDGQLIEFKTIPSFTKLQGSQTGRFTTAISQNEHYLQKGTEMHLDLIRKQIDSSR